ncbi:MAG TPA: YjgB family protein [Candidatus Udaeobacter sp.]|nr:YjgB family protein [Candidatus Udaeobacter sp.]
MNQTKRFKQFAISISFAIAISLTACSNNDTSADQTPPPSAEAPSVQPSSEPSVEPSTEPSAQPGNAANGNDAPEPSNSSSEAAVTIGSLVELAKEGKVPNCSYAAHTALFDEIEQKWGKPDSNDSAGKGQYAVYEDKGITFGYNKGMLVFDVRSYDSMLQTIAPKDIEAALGKADEKTVSGSDDIYTYQVNDQYQLKFAVSQSTGKVDHISVYSPEDAKNNMAG